jgi:hypothetical protein
VSDLFPEPMKTLARRVKREALGMDSCLLCGAVGFEVIVPISVGLLTAVPQFDSSADEPGSFRDQIRLSLEDHHLFGRDLDPDLTVPLCRNCHAAVHALLRDVGVDFRRLEMPTVLHRVLAMLRILAAFFQQLATSLSHEADRLALLIGRLDLELPDWRRVVVVVA